MDAGTIRLQACFFLPFDIALSQDVPFGILQYIQCMLMDLNLSSFVSHFILLTAQGVGN